MLDKKGLASAAVSPAAGRISANCESWHSVCGGGLQFLDDTLAQLLWAVLHHSEAFPTLLWLVSLLTILFDHLQWILEPLRL